MHHLSLYILYQLSSVYHLERLVYPLCRFQHLAQSLETRVRNLVDEVQMCVGYFDQKCNQNFLLNNLAWN